MNMFSIFKRVTPIVETSSKEVAQNDSKPKIIEISDSECAKIAGAPQIHNDPQI